MYPYSNRSGIRQDAPRLDAPLRIGFFTDVYLPMVNGAVVSIDLLVRELRNAGHHVSVFAPRFPGFRDNDAEVYRLPSVRYMKLPPIYIAVPGTPRALLKLRRSQFDILHVHSPLSVGFLAYVLARTKHVPLVYTNHCSITDYTHYVKFVGGTRPIRYAARWFSSTSANLSDRVVVPSAKFDKLLQEQKVHRPIHIIPNGIDLTNFYASQETGALRGRLGLGPDHQLLVFVGRVDPEKRIDLVIEMFNRVAPHFPDSHLVIVGDGSARKKLEKQAGSSLHKERIHFTGMINRADLPGILHDGDLFVSATTSETQCLAMIEAIAAGLPVAAIWDDAFEGILEDGVNGRVAQDVETFSSVVHDLLADPETRKRYSKNSMELSRNFSVESQVAALVRLYRKAISAQNEALTTSP